MGEYFWRLAMAKDARSREDWLEILLKTLAQSASDRETLRALAAKMITRHEQMFPDLHSARAAGAQK
jgi:threonine synthase